MFNTRKKLLFDINVLQNRLEAMNIANEDLQKQLRTVEHGIGLDRLRHELEVEEARQQGRRQGDELVRNMERIHADNIIRKLESLNDVILQRLPHVNVDKVITREEG